jgi:hypothetical protein
METNDGNVAHLVRLRFRFLVAPCKDFSIFNNSIRALYSTSWPGMVTQQYLTCYRAISDRKGEQIGVFCFLFGHF